MKFRWVVAAITLMAIPFGTAEEKKAEEAKEKAPDSKAEKSRSDAEVKKAARNKIPEGLSEDEWDFIKGYRKMPDMLKDQFPQMMEQFGNMGEEEDEEDEDDKPKGKDKKEKRKKPAELDDEEWDLLLEFLEMPEAGQERVMQVVKQMSQMGRMGQGRGRKKKQQDDEDEE